jgi:hypothetical protein
MIINNGKFFILIVPDTYERKGRLWKKSLNSEVFKERTFVLEKDHLFYFKSEKNSKYSAVTL